MQIHDITRRTGTTDRKRVGRGGKRGKTSGKGMKGQNARTGNSKRPEIRDIIKKYPKLRGQGKNGNRNSDIITYFAPVNLAALEVSFEKGDLVTPKTLLAKGLISYQKGRIPQVKILGSGDISKAVKVKGCAASESAIAKITKAGGEVAQA